MHGLAAGQFTSVIVKMFPSRLGLENAGRPGEISPYSRANDCYHFLLYAEQAERMDFAFRLLFWNPRPHLRDLELMGKQDETPPPPLVA